MGVEPFHALAVERAAALCPARRQAQRGRYGNIGPVKMRAGVVQNLVERDAGKIGELHLDDRPHSLERRADGRADHRVLADGRVQNPPGKFLSQAFGRFESAAEFSGNVLPVKEDAVILLEKVSLGFANGFEVGDAHTNWSIRERVDKPHQSSSFACGTSSCWAVETASSTSAAISERICCKAS